MRPIDADVLEREHCSDCNEEAREICKNDPICATMMWVREAPTIDYAPIVHGEWKYFTTSEKTVHITNWLQCSVCGRMWDRLEGTKYNYCPSCGAKMDGGKKDG